jgi:hypothetical protein
LEAKDSRNPEENVEAVPSELEMREVKKILSLKTTGGGDRTHTP